MAAKSVREFRCKDCGLKDMAMFILKNEVWLSIAEKDDILCFSCAEKRLGRDIVFDDLQKCVLKKDLALGAALMARAMSKMNFREMLQFLSLENVGFD